MNLSFRMTILKSQSALVSHKFRKTPRYCTPQNQFALIPNLPVGLTRLEMDHMRKAQLPAVIFFPRAPADDYWQVSGGPRREG